MQAKFSTAPGARKRLAVVGRVSTLDQERYGTSLEDQARTGELLAQLHSMDVVDSSAYQGDESGTLPLKARPIMQRILADARARKFDAVVFHKIDRIARKLSYILEIWDALDDAGVTVYIIEPTIDTSDMMGRLLRNILGTIAEFERDLLVDRTSGGRNRDMARGAIYLPRGKYGYQYVRRDRASGVMPHVKEHPEHAENVRLMYRLRRQRWSYTRIADLLTSQGHRTPSQVAGHKHVSTRWYDATVAQIIGDPTYMGQGGYGRRVKVAGKDGKRVQRLRADGHVPVKMEFPTIVTPEEWYAANAVSKERGPCVVHSDVERYLLIGGMVRCREHDRAMCGSAGGKRGRYYRCARRKDCGGWQSHGVPADILETRVWDTICGTMLDEEYMVGAADRIAREAEEGLEDACQRKTQILARLEKLDDEIRWINRSLRASGASAQEIADQKAEVYAEQQSLHAELEPLDALISLKRQELPQAAHIRAICQTFMERAAHADARGKRALLDELEVRVEMDGTHFWIDGVLRELELEGDVGVQPQASLTRCLDLYTKDRSADRRALAFGIPFTLEGYIAS